MRRGFVLIVLTVVVGLAAAAAPALAESHEEAPPQPVIAGIASSMDAVDRESHRDEVPVVVHDENARP